MQQGLPAILLSREKRHPRKNGIPGRGRLPCRRPETGPLQTGATGEVELVATESGVGKTTRL